MRARGCCQLIASHLEVRRWLLKIDADFANMGVAYLDVAALPIVDEVHGDASGRPKGLGLFGEK